MRILLFLFVLIATTAEAGTYWAAPGGNDAGACASSVSDPGVYLTIGRAAECATVAPWTILLKGNLGIYNSSNHLIDTSTRHSAMLVNGTSAGSPNIVQGAPGESRPSIVGAGAGGIVSLYRNPRNNITFREFISDGQNTSGQAFYLEGNNLVLEDCEIKNNGDFGVFSYVMYGSPPSQTFPYSNHTIRRCKIHGTVGGGGSTTFGSYAWYGSPKNSIFEDNEVYDVTASGIQLQYDNDNVIVRRNWFHDIKRQGPTGTCNGMTNSARYDANGTKAGGAVGVQIYNNKIDIRTCPSGLTYGLQNHQSTGVLVANNQFMGGQYSVYFAFGISANVQLTNNIMLGSAGSRIFIETTGGDGLGSTYTASYSACESGANCATSSNGTTSNKQTIAAITDCSVSSSDFHHKTGLTNCKDHGTTVGAVTSDFDQVVRPQNGVYDIGPYEFPTSTPTAPAPPTGVTIQ